ncbi:MAG TPA: hypothetical protein VMF91_02775 [Bryobacteraceae bacterium]|nr:hypothetical protein [Bryobacteraceae bacterium]
MAKGRKLRAAGDFAQAILNFTIAARRAHEIADLDREAVALRESSACYASLYQYHNAVELARRSRALALQANDHTSAGEASLILSSIYRLLGNLALAENQSDYAVRELADTPRRDFLAKALLSRGTLEMQEGKDTQALNSINRAISVAHEASMVPVEGVAWDFTGLLLLNQGNLPDAEKALSKAAGIQTSLHDTDSLAVTHEHLAELEFRKGSYAAALKFIDQAFAADAPSFKINPEYYPVHVRAQILLGLGRTHDALLEFQHAVNLASEWRSGALPGDVTSTLTAAQLHEVYEDYTELAALFAFKNHDSALARDALQELAENRASSLREQLSLSLDQNLRLPPEYFELLSELQKEQASVTFGDKPQEHEAKLREIRLQLSNLSRTRSA